MREPFEHRDRQTIGSDDYNPAAARAIHERARRIADEMAESYRRRLVASGVRKDQARALAEREAKVGDVIGTAKRSATR